MSNNQLIAYFKLGKYNIDNTKLSPEDKIRLLRLENLTKDLVEFYEKVNSYMIQFNSGHFKDEEAKDGT